MGPLESSILIVGVTIAAFALLAWLFPARFLRLLFWLRCHTLLRLEAIGTSRVPREGGALLVCNAVLHLDWLFVWLVCPRPLRFVIFDGSDRFWLARHILRWTNAIVIPTDATPRQAVAVLRTARKAVEAGEVVCMFTGGAANDRGVRLSYARTYRRLTRGLRAPVIPVCLDQTYGSLYSVSPDGKLSRRWPVRIPHRAYVVFQREMPAGTPAGDVRQEVQKLWAGSAIERTPDRRPVHRQFVRMAAHQPFRTCLVDSISRGKGLTYGKALAGAMCLRKLLRPMLGDAAMVALWLPPSIGGALANISLALMGKVSVNLNYTSSTEVVRACLTQAGARHVLTSRKFAQRMPIDPGPGVELVYLEDLLPKVSNFQRLTAFLTVLLLPGWLLERYLGLTNHKPDDLATVIFSSGSTGDPKGVMLTHGNIAGNAEAIVEGAGVTRADRLLAVLPLFHSFGYTVTLWTPLQCGAASVFHPDPRQAKEIGELARTYSCTIYVSTATFLRFCLKKCEPEEFRTLRLIMCGAEKLPMPLAEEFAKKFGVRPMEGYGCTELSPAAVINMPDVRIGNFTLVRNNPGTIGQPLPGCAGKIVDPETAQPLPFGAEGLLLMTGPNVMKGYLHRPDLTEQVILDGWYVTGDMGRLDENGYITLTGRLARFAKVGGEMVPLERIEEELHDILQTTERVCAVTCVPDEARGERLVVLYLAESVEMRPWGPELGSRGLPNLWIPSDRDFYPVSELPILGSGKLNLKRVKEMALDLARPRR